MDGRGRDPEPGRQCIRGEMVGILKFRRRLPHASRYRAFVRGFLFEPGNRSLHSMVPGEGERRGRHALSGFCAVRRRGHKVDSTPLLTFGSPVLQDHPFAGNDHFSHWRAAAAIAQHEALADSTHAKRDSSWRRYECFLELIGGRLDPFLRQLGQREQLETFACFAAALREGRMDARRRSTDCIRALAGTVRAVLDGVAQAYRLNQFESPIHDGRGRLEPILALQLREYADADPGVRQQQALPIEVLQRARRRNGNVREVAIGQLIVVAFFFAMRSCEYSCVQGKRMTTIVGVDDI